MVQERRTREAYFPSRYTYWVTVPEPNRARSVGGGRTSCLAQGVPWVGEQVVLRMCVRTDKSARKPQCSSVKYAGFSTNQLTGLTLSHNL